LRFSSYSKAVSALAMLSMAALSPAPAVKEEPPSNRGGCVALTFDDGPDATLTPLLLSILERENVQATFFVLGERAAANPDIVKREQVGANEIGNHTWDHHLLPSLTDDEVVSEIVRTDTAILKATGHRPDLIRPPYGIINKGVEDTLRDRGLLRPIAMWDIDTLDWLGKNAAQITQAASQGVAGSVILMHDIHPATVQAVPEIIRRLRERGLRLTTFNDLAACLNEVPRDRQSGSHLAAQSLAQEMRSGQSPPVQLTAGRLLGTLLSLRRLIERQVN
jgi:peptidoglycan-N-acetylglucosamine deacetylase